MIPESWREGGENKNYNIVIRCQSRYTFILFIRGKGKIEKDGKVTNVEMEKGSGNRFFDESVLRAIGKASPLPVPPEKLRGTEDHYEVGFRFREPKGAW